VAETKLGLTHTNELLLCDGILNLDRISATFKLGLLIMFLQHIKTVRKTADVN